MFMILPGLDISTSQFLVSQTLAEPSGHRRSPHPWAQRGAVSRWGQTASVAPWRLVRFRRQLCSSEHYRGRIQSSNALQDCRESRCTSGLGHGHFCHLEDYIPGVRDHLRTDLDELLPQCRQRPVLHRLRQRQATQEVAQIVRQCEQLETNLVVHKVVAAQPRPLHRVLAFFYPLLRRTAAVIKLHRPAGRASQVRHDEP